MKTDKRDILALFVFLIAYILVGNFNNLVSWILGTAFLIAFLYGVISVYKKEKFIF